MIREFLDSYSFIILNQQITSIKKIFIQLVKTI